MPSRATSPRVCVDQLHQFVVRRFRLRKVAFADRLRSAMPQMVALQPFQICRFNFWANPRSLARAAMNFASAGCSGTAGRNTTLHVHIPPGGIVHGGSEIVNRGGDVARSE